MIVFFIGFILSLPYDRGVIEATRFWCDVSAASGKVSPRHSLIARRVDRQFAAASIVKRYFSDAFFAALSPASFPDVIAHALFAPEGESSPITPPPTSPAA